jgi:hypothetical protein
MINYPPEPLDFSGLHTYSVHGRHSKVSVDDFASPLQPGMTVRQLLAALPTQLAGGDFPDLVHRIAEAHRNGCPIILGMGAHVIKVGLNPILIDLMRRGIITAVALNGAGIIHDSEIAMVGRTSEEVADVLGAGAFGAAKETGETLNQAIVEGARQGIGIGQAVGEMLLARQYPHNGQSLLAMAAKLQVPVTVHVAMGTDIIHIHPSADGRAITTFGFSATWSASLRGGSISMSARRCSCRRSFSRRSPWCAISGIRSNGSPPPISTLSAITGRPPTSCTGRPLKAARDSTSPVTMN